MRTVIVCTSVSHGNTRKIAEAMAAELDARVVTAEEANADPALLAEADLVGFGSGVFYARLHPSLLDVAKALPVGPGRTFVFATSGFPELPPAPFFRPLVRLLESKGRTVQGRYSCRAFDTWAPLRLVGGVNKNRPNDDDLAEARTFARHLKQTT
ncbi:flavodoxin family protein [Streptomyces sp. XM4193]|uniref:flavodoxin family protein n=1 Tax=Streptomyces sp. XM4193 TaxID=2929782 RepID=UPI001FF83984|nr:flavodoxin family protein [Streptomyces sp. XM4193]MCK1796244.1 flavodoxin family protein [Streptomyces sp. XM4193]